MLVVVGGKLQTDLTSALRDVVLVRGLFHSRPPDSSIRSNLVRSYFKLFYISGQKFAYSFPPVSNVSYVGTPKCQTITEVSA